LQKEGKQSLRNPLKAFYNEPIKCQDISFNEGGVVRVGRKTETLSLPTPTTHKVTTPYKGLNKGKMYNTNMMNNK
jgi:hypothetical protein